MRSIKNQQTTQGEQKGALHNEPNLVDQFHLCFGIAQKNGGRSIVTGNCSSITRSGKIRISFGGGGNIYTYPSIIQTWGWGLNGPEACAR